MIRIAMISLALLSCEKTKETELKSQEQYVWFKTPDQIEQIVKESWKIRVSSKEAQLYFRALGNLYGGMDNIEHRTLLQDKASGSYLLAINVVATWLSDKLISHGQTVGENNSRTLPFIFKGDHQIDSDECFVDDNKDWCDFDDEITLGMFSKDNLPTRKEDRKRIMHNIQDIGDFLQLTIDNRVSIDAFCQPNSTCQHVPQYLLDKVFIPALQEQSNDKNIRDRSAWQQVVHAILMSGGFFTNIEFKIGEY